MEIVNALLKTINYTKLLHEALDNVKEAGRPNLSEHILELLNVFERNPDFIFDEGERVLHLNNKNITPPSFLIKLVDSSASDELILKAMSYPWINQDYINKENLCPTVSSLAFLCYQQKENLVEFILDKGISAQVFDEKAKSSPILFYITQIPAHKINTPFFKKLCLNVNLKDDENALKYIFMHLLRHHSKESSLEKIKYLINFASIDIDNFLLYNDYEIIKYYQNHDKIKSINFIHYALLGDDLSSIEYCLQATKDPVKTIKFLNSVLKSLEKTNNLKKQVKDLTLKIQLLKKYSLILSEKSELEKVISPKIKPSQPISFTRKNKI